MTTMKRRHLYRTLYMLLLETRHLETPIDMILLYALRESAGSFTGAAKSLKISKATFSRWIVQLDLKDDAEEIRAANKLKPLPSSSY